MSNSASISAAKKRRGGMPPPMAGGPGQPGQQMNLPPGLPPNFRQLPPQVQQQLFQQLQQRMAVAASAPPKPASAPQQQSMPPAPLQTRNPMSGNSNGNGNGKVTGATINVPGPYTVNPVIHNRAMAEVDGIHIRDLPISSSGLPCLPSGAALPPNVLFKLHHDELLNMDAILNEHSNKIQMLSNKVDKAERVNGASSNGASSNGASSNGASSNGASSNGATANKGEQNNTSIQSEQRNVSYDNLVNNTEFIAKLLDNILTNTNLSEIINQIEPLQKENESLRSLLNSQQTTLNELSGLVMKLISNGLPSYTTGGDNIVYGGDDGGDGGDNIVDGDGDGDGDDGGDNIVDGDGGDDDIAQNDVLSSVYSPYITNNDTDGNMNNVSAHGGSNYNENNYSNSEEGGVCSVSLDNLEELRD